MREPASTTPHEAAVMDDDRMAFVAFALGHAACGDGVLEVRLGERCLLEWCSACDVMRAFVTTKDPGSRKDP